MTGHNGPSGRIPAHCRPSNPTLTRPKRRRFCQVFAIDRSEATGLRGAAKYRVGAQVLYPKGNCAIMENGRWEALQSD